MGATHSGEVNKRSSRKVSVSPAGSSHRNNQQLPELRIQTSTWTRESHGLYDFEGVEIERKSFRVKGNQRVFRHESEVEIRATELNNFYEQEQQMSADERERIVARILYFNSHYWIYHKNFVDSQIDQVLEKKPEEKIWRVVRENICAEMETPCYRLCKRDLIKVGRVRFKIRDIMSPVYAQIEKLSNEEQRQFLNLFPSVNESAVSQMDSFVDEEPAQPDPTQNLIGPEAA